MLAAQVSIKIQVLAVVVGELMALQITHLEALEERLLH